MILALDAMSLIVVGLAPSRSSQGDRSRRSKQDDHKGRMLGKELAEGHALWRSRTVSGDEMVGQRASVENDGAAGDGGRDAASRRPPSGCREQEPGKHSGRGCKTEQQRVRVGHCAQSSLLMRYRVQPSACT
jgi:hypothetical protein